MSVDGAESVSSAVTGERLLPRVLLSALTATAGSLTQNMSGSEEFFR